MEESKAESIIPQKKTCNNCSGDSALFQCGKCTQVHYCSKKCQVEDWKKSHKKNCYPLKVQVAEDGRRHVYAAKSFQAGDIMWKEVPLVIGPVDIKLYQHTYKRSSMSVTTELCICCCNEVWPHQGIRCQCGLMTCGKANCLDDAMHKSTECSILKILTQGHGKASEISHYISPTDIALFLRILQLKNDIKSWTKFLELNDYPVPVNVEKFQEITIAGKMCPEALEPLYKEGKITFIEYRYNAQYRELCRLLIDVAKIPDLTEADISEIMGRVYWNSLDDESVIAMDHYTHKKWICYFGSTTDHSCSPNVMWKISSSNGSQEVVFRAIKPINVGDEIFAWRNMVLENTGYYTTTRRVYLLDFQGFECCCLRCRDPTEEGSFNSAMKCLDANCSGAMLRENPLYNESDWKCNTCGCTQTAQYFNNLIEQATSLQNSLNDLLEPYLTKNSNSNDWMKAINEAEKVISSGIRMFFHPKNAWIKLGWRDICAVFYTQIQGLTKSKESKLNTKLIVNYARDVIRYCKQMLDDQTDFSLAGLTRWRGYMLTVYYISLAFLKVNGTKEKIAEFAQDLEKMDLVAKEAKFVLDFYKDEPMPTQYLNDIERFQSFFKPKISV